MEDFIRISLETHLFFARIMKEHALFLQAGFVGKDTDWIRRAEFFRTEFEALLRETVEISNRMISGTVLRSQEIVTPFTISAESATSRLSGIPIDSDIARLETRLSGGCMKNAGRGMVQRVRRLNVRAIRLLNGLIAFKENIIREVARCRRFTMNYPLLVRHIQREARLYRATLEELMRGRRVSFQDLQNTENFWNQIMMEHALFIRGLLDPSEEELIGTANEFAMDFKELLTEARERDTYAMDGFRERSLVETRKLREFKEAGTKGLIECRIESIMLPLLADHVLREANHYIRLLEHGYQCEEA